MKRKIKSNSLFLTVCGFICLCGIILLIFGVKSYYIGFHNIDTAYNMINLESKYNIKLLDIATNEKMYSQTEIYHLGIRYQEIGFIYSMCSLSLFSYYFAILLGNLKIKKFKK